jgi:hypothetical protein
MRKIRPHWRKTLIVDQLLHHVQTEETLFLQLDHVPSKHKLSSSYMVAVLTILWPFMQLFLENLSPTLVI